MAIQVIKGRYPHVGWVDLEQKGVLTEIAILKNGPQGLMFIKLGSLDGIDRQRLYRIISNRNANMYELWDLMSNLTLGNGANALEYFHQCVKVLTPSGQIMNPTMGRIAAPHVTGVRTVQRQDAPTAPAVLAEDVPAPVVAKKTTRRTTKSAPAAE